MCQVLVLSVFNGFEGLVKSLYSNFYTDIKVLPATGKTFTLTQSQLKNIQNIPGIKGTSFNVEEKALLQNGEDQTVVLLRGVDSNYYKVSGVPDLSGHCVEHGESILMGLHTALLSFDGFGLSTEETAYGSQHEQ